MTFEDKTAAPVPALGVDSEVLEVGEFEDVAVPAGPLLGEVTPLGWKPPARGITYDEWADEGLKLRRVHHGVLWAVGDWLNYGDRKWGEMYVQAASRTGYTNGFLRDMKWIANRFPELSARADNSFSHLRRVAPLSNEHADRFLRLARDNKWGKDVLAGKIKEWKDTAAAIRSGAVSRAQSSPGCVSLGVAAGESDVEEAAKEIRDIKTAEKRKENAGVAAGPAAVPDGKFETIVIDPPWAMSKIVRDVRPNQVGFEYPTMDATQLRDFGSTIGALAADDAHLFMWTTHKFLPLALTLVDEWGFRYVFTMVWHKPGGFQPVGLAQYNCEFILYARRGSPEFLDTKAFNCCFSAERREHSRKPDEFYAIIERVTVGPRIDVFSREARDGFAQFGNETAKFTDAAE